MGILNFIARLFGLSPGGPGETPRERGRFGEDEAAKWLRKKKGYTVVCCNWRHGRDEIDLVCRDGKILVFVEVKTRKSDAAVPGYYSVTKKKKKILLRVCKAYLKCLKSPPKHFRFDIVEVGLKGNGGFCICHYENVLLFSKHFHVNAGESK